MYFILFSSKKLLSSSIFHARVVGWTSWHFKQCITISFATEELADFQNFYKCRRVFCLKIFPYKRAINMNNYTLTCASSATCNPKHRLMCFMSIILMIFRGTLFILQLRRRSLASDTHIAIQKTGERWRFWVEAPAVPPHHISCFFINHFWMRKYRMFNSSELCENLHLVVLHISNLIRHLNMLFFFIILSIESSLCS